MQILKKLFCCHDWEKIYAVEYIDAVVVLLKCKKCGKLEKKVI